MNEEIQVEEIQTNVLQIEKIETNLQEVNSSVNKLLEFFQTEKEENIKKEQEEIKKIEEEQRIQEEEQIKIEEEQRIQEKEQQKKEQEFLSDIQTIAENTNTEINTQLLQDVSALMQVNIMTSGLLIGIVCICLFAKFFKR